MEEKELKIRGMFGEHCERAITDALSQISGVSELKVKNGTISFVYDKNPATLLAVKDAITDEGYDVIG
ncbi:MAG: cation transporter [Treponema sp.]|nr:cation transporter [Treponema sp.]